MKLKILAIVLLLVVGGGALAAALGVFPTGAAAATTYLTGTAAAANVRDDVAATGTIAASTTWSLAFGLATTTGELPTPTGDAGTWTVGEVSVKVGDVVTKDQVLATATNSAIAASVAAAVNDRTVARLQLATAQEAYDAAVTTDELRQTRSSLLNATNAAAAADSRLTDLRATAGRNKLTAPAPGIVTTVAIATGAAAGSGAAITLASTDYDVTASVVETDVAKMQIGQAATVVVSAIGATVDGTVAAIAPAATESTSGGLVSYAVTVALATPPATLRPGMTADVTITTAAADGVLAVPAAALRGQADNYSVLVLSSAGVPEARPVTVGLMTSSLVEIKSGLSAGDVVVTGTSSTQRTTTTTGAGAGGLVIPGGGGGGGGGGRGVPAPGN
jgi:RND family efflux transporter MFP subunit